MKTVVGLFKAYEDANSAITELEGLGYTHDDMAILAQEYVMKRSGLAEGAAAGATVGGLTGLLMGLTAFTLPGIGPALATASLLSSTAMGAGVGATVGGIVGTLVDLGISEEEAEVYAEGVKRGGILVAVKAKTKSQEGEAARILTKNGAVNIMERQKAWSRDGWKHFDETMEPARARAVL